MTGKSFPILFAFLLACGPDHVDDVDELACEGLFCACEHDEQCSAPLGTEPLCIGGLCTHVCTAIPCDDAIDGVTCGPLTDAGHQIVPDTMPRRVCMMPCEIEASICPELEDATCTNVPPPAIPAGDSPLVCAS